MHCCFFQWLQVGLRHMILACRDSLSQHKYTHDTLHLWSRMVKPLMRKFVYTNHSPFLCREKCYRLQVNMGLVVD